MNRFTKPSTSCQLLCLFAAVLLVNIWWLGKSNPPQKIRQPIKTTTKFTYAYNARGVLNIDIPQNPSARTVDNPFLIRHNLSGTEMILWNSGELEWVTAAINEIQINEIFVERLSNGCQPNEIVIDLGANAGFSGIYAGLRGCKTLLFEPQPRCVFYAQSAINANGISDLALVVPFPVSDKPITLKVSNDTNCDGGFPHKFMHTDLASTIEVPSVNLDDIIKDEYRIKLLKIDTEASEMFILNSIKNLVRQNRVDTIIVELTPIYWGDLGVTRSQVAEVFAEIAILGGYRAKMLDDTPNHYLNTTKQIRDYVEFENFVQWDMYLYKD